jgi:ankyrin repeat protein
MRNSSSVAESTRSNTCSSSGRRCHSSFQRLIDEKVTACGDYRRESEGSMMFNVRAQMGRWMRCALGLALVSGVVFANPFVELLQGQPRDGQTQLLRAAQAGDTRRATELLGAGVPVDSRSEHDLATPLMLAIEGRNLQLCRLLLERGANPNAIALRGDTPLTRALRRNGDDEQDEFVRLLLDHSADVNLHGEMDVAPLCIAALYGRATAARLLLEAGAKVDQRAGLSQAPALQYAVTGSSPVEMVSLLLAAGADLNAIDSDGRTALSEAAACGREDVVTMLLRAGADAALADRTGATPADRAAEADHPGIAAMLRLQHRRLRVER